MVKTLNTYFWRTVNLGSQLSRSTSGPITVGARLILLFCALLALFVAPEYLLERDLRRCRGFAMSVKSKKYVRPKIYRHVVVRPFGLGSQATYRQL